MYKKREVIEAKITEAAFPNTGVFRNGAYTVCVKGALVDSVVSAKVLKKRGETITAELIEVLEKAPYETAPSCRHFGPCGGCCYQHVPYEKQLDIKEAMVLSLFEESGISINEYLGVSASPERFCYRNKMEFSFGDTGLGGELSLGLRKKKSHYEVVHVSDCMLVDSDIKAVLNEALRFFKSKNIPFYNTRTRQGLLRHLVIRKSRVFGDMLVNLVTANDFPEQLLTEFKDVICALSLKGKISGVLHTQNDSLADVVKLSNVNVLFGRDYFWEEVCGLKFKITPESFFQTNTRGAEILYNTALAFAGDFNVAFDLYCGTGTITQLLSLKGGKAVGVELSEQAVNSARETALLNGIKNAEFICGDCLDVIGNIGQKPDVIVLDPPREGVHPKALKKIADFGAQKIVYISCKPTSLVKDLKILCCLGYEVLKLSIVDMFPNCAHVETVVLLSKLK